MQVDDSLCPSASISVRGMGPQGWPRAWSAPGVPVSRAPPFSGLNTRPLFFQAALTDAFTAAKLTSSNHSQHSHLCIFQVLSRDLCTGLAVLLTLPMASCSSSLGGGKQPVTLTLTSAFCHRTPTAGGRCTCHQPHRTGHEPNQYLP